MDLKPSAVPKLLLWTVGATVALWIVLFLDLPWLQQLPGWFWPLTDAPRPQPVWIAMAIALCAAVAWKVSRPSSGRVTTAVLLLFLGVALQWSFALTEGRGHQALRDRMIVSGHTAFLHEAVTRNVAQDSPWRVARQYPEMIEAGELPRYPFATKPPGTLIVFMMHERLTALWPNRHGDREARAVTSATLVFPLFAAAAALPLLGLGDRRRNQVYLPPFLYLSIPAALLMTLHLDQALFPLLAALVFRLCANAPDAKGWRGLVAAGSAGALAGLSCFVSYAFLAVLVFGALVFLLGLHRGPGPGRLAAFGGGALAALVGLRVTLGFDLLRGLEAVNRHRDWKITHWDFGTTLSIGLVDLVELAVWTGPPVFVLACLGCIHGARRLAGRDADPKDSLERRGSIDTFGVALTLVVLLLAFAGRTVGEVARLWLFLQPAIALLAACELTRRTESLPYGARRAAWVTVVATQLLHTGALKLWMDFV